MKKGLLFCLSIALSLGAMAQQVAEHLPNGFRRAKVPSSMLNYSVKVPYRMSAIDNQVPLATSSIPRTNARSSSLPPSDEMVVGNTFYDLQTNNSISNRLCVNDDGTISMAWTFSPDAISTSTPPFPHRGSGYNYWDGANLLYPAGPTLREELVRTGFTNIVVTPVSELLIAHNAVAGTGDFNQIAVSYRAGKGSGTWSTTYPWGNTGHDTWPKACAAGSSGSNNNVYVVFQGSGAPSNTASPAYIVEGQQGPIYFARSTDGGLTWEPKRVIDLIDSNYYAGFGGDCYSIDAKGDTVAITFGDTYTDVGLLKSTDGGVTWTKKIIQKHPIPFYLTCNCGTYYIPNAMDTTVDTVYSNGGDSKVLIDNAGLCHVWFSEFNYHDADSTDNLYNPHDGTDGIDYWNENMPEDVGGTRSYVTIASAQDFNSNDQIDAPVDTFTNCSNRNPWGDYGGGISQMPSAGIDANGRIYLTYQTVVEAPAGDTTFFHALHRHPFMMTLNPPYDPATWSYPYDIIPSSAQGGSGETQEGVFACTGRRVDNDFAYVLYQRDDAPGHALAADGTCDKLKNASNSSDMILARMDVSTVNIQTANQNDLFVSQNYPNPSTGLTVINLGLKKSSKVNIEVNDMIGKVVYKDSKGLMSSGNHTIELNTSGWETGVYTYTVSAEGMKITRQMIVQ
jgi:hypothetical protein